MPQISFITTCKGRLDHLKETLPLWVSEHPDEIIVVDYGCPQHASQWLDEHYPDVVSVKVTDDPGFSVSRARNIGVRHASSPWLVFIDADIRVRPGWVEWMRRHLLPNHFYRVGQETGPRDLSTWGTFICWRPNFDMVEGFDEVFEGWGGEDRDLYARLARARLRQAAFPSGFISPIQHSDQLRTQYHDQRDLDSQHFINELYQQAKYLLMGFSRDSRQPSREAREKLMASIRSRVLVWREHNTDSPPEISLALKARNWMPEPYWMERTMRFTLKVTRRESTAG